MVGTLDKMWCFSIDDVVDVALTCCQSFGPTTDSALVRRRGFSEVYFFFIDGGVERYFGLGLLMDLGYRDASPDAMDSLKANCYNVVI